MRAPDVGGQPRTPTDAKRPHPPRKRSPIVTQLVKQVHHSAKIVSLQRLIQKGSERRFRCSDAIFVLVGDTRIEPVTSSVSGIIFVLDTPLLSTKTVRRHPLISPHIRGRCHAIGQSPNHQHVSGRQRTVHGFPTGKYSQPAIATRSCRRLRSPESRTADMVPAKHQLGGSQGWPVGRPQPNATHWRRPQHPDSVDGSTDGPSSTPVRQPAPRQ